MSEVKALPFPIQKVKTRAMPHAPLVRMLEGMLESAKNGELQSVACACVYANDLEPGGGTSYGLQAAPYTRYAMAHAMSLLNYKITDWFHGD